MAKRSMSGRVVRCLVLVAVLALGLPVPAAQADPLGPSVTVAPATGQADPTDDAPIKFTATFSQAVTDFDDIPGDVMVGGTANPNPALTVITPVSTTVYTIEVTGMTASGPVEVSIPENVADGLLGLLGNMASADPPAEVEFDRTDTTAPTVALTVAAGQANPTGSFPVNFTATFREPVTGFTGSDVTIGGTATGTKAAMVTGGPTTYTIAVTITGSPTAGTVNVTVPANVVSDMGGNLNTPAATSPSVNYAPDTTRPTVTVNKAEAQQDPTATSPIVFTAVFSEPVTGFAMADVTTGGTAGGTRAVTVTGGPATFTISVALSGTPTAGTVTATIAENVAMDAAGNSNTASTFTDNSVDFQPGAPTVTVDQASGQDDPTTASPIGFTAVFSEAVTGFGNAAGDVTIAGTAGGTTTATVTGGPTTYTISVALANPTDGTIIVSVPAGAAQDAQSTGNIASTSTDNTVNFGEGVVPLVEDDSYSVPAGGTLDVDAPGVLGNDTLEGDDQPELTATLVDDVGNGELVLEGDGAFNYTPGNGFTGTDTFTYTATTGTLVSEAAAVTITVTEGTIVIEPGVGDDNIARAIAWSRATTVESSFAQSGRTVLLGRDDLFADSLSSGGAQGVLDAPLLLTGSGGLDARTDTELDRLGAQRVILLGGTAALSEQVVTDLTARSYVVERVFGPSRLETAAEVARRISPTTTQVVIARAFPADGGEATQAFADALAAGALAADLGIPLLLTETGRLSDATRAYLEAAGVTQALLVGGDAAIAPQVVQDLTGIGVVSIRLFGDTRFSTATAIAGQRGARNADDAAATILVNGTDANAWADAFPAALLAADSLTPIVLADGDTLPTPTQTYLSGGATPLICGTTATGAACAAAEAALAG